MKKPSYLILALGIFATVSSSAATLGATPTAPEPWALPQGEAMEATAPRLIPASAQEASPPRPLFSRAARLPLAGAAGDSISTYVALHQPGVVESNGLINTSPLGLIGLFALKAGAVYVADQMPERDRQPLLKTFAGLWTGVTFSNLVIAAGATTPAGLAVGVVAGIFGYRHEAEVLAEEARGAAGKAQVGLSSNSPLP